MQPTSAVRCFKREKHGMTLIEVLLALFILMLVSVTIGRSLITILRLETQSKHQFEFAIALSTVLHDEIQWKDTESDPLLKEKWDIIREENDMGKKIQLTPKENPRIHVALSFEHNPSVKTSASTSE